MHQCIKFILFWNDTLHVSDGAQGCIQGVPVGKVSILGGHSTGHSKQKYLYEHVSYPNGFQDIAI